MNPHTIKRLFPNASRSTLLANVKDYGANHPDAEISDAKPAKQAPALDGHDEGEAPGARRVTVCFTLCRVRLLDADAKAGSCKDIIDGCVKAGLIPGDREDQINLEVIQTRVAHYADEKTVIQLWL